jgi:hypothetical protein
VRETFGTVGSGTCGAGTVGTRGISGNCGRGGEGRTSVGSVGSGAKAYAEAAITAAAAAHAKKTPSLSNVPGNLFAGIRRVETSVVHELTQRQPVGHRLVARGRQLRRKRRRETR